MLVCLTENCDRLTHSSPTNCRGGSLFQFYRERYNCQVDIYGVWGDEADDPMLLCDPYALVTSEEGKQQVDRCIQFIGYRIKEHEEKYGAHVEHNN